MKIIIFIMFILLSSLSCSKKESPKVVEQTVEAKVVQLQGKIINQVSTTEAITLQPTSIITDNGSIVKDGYEFKVESTEGILFSTDNGLTYDTKGLIKAQNGNLNIFLKTPQSVGSYKFKLSATNSLAQCFFYINVLPSATADLGKIIFSKFQDKAPFNGIKDDNESYILLADGNSFSDITIGPIKDAFSNNVSDVKLKMSTDMGTIISENPVSITDGSGFFRLLSSPTLGTANIVIEALDSNDNRLFASSATVEFTKPIITVSGETDFGNVFINNEKINSLIIKNTGGMTASNLSFSTTAPFFIKNDSSCLTKNKLNPEEECELKVSFLTGNRIQYNENLRIISSPTNIATSNLTIPLSAKGVLNASLNLISDSTYNFNTVKCGTVNKKTLLIKNIGDIDAHNISIANSAPLAGFSEPFYRLENPIADSIIPSNINDPYYCGNTFPAGRTCKIDVIFNPMKLLDASFSYSSLSYDESPNPLTISMSGLSEPGDPAGVLPINIKTPTEISQNITTPVDHILLNDTQIATIEIGPIKDICNNIVKDGTLIKSYITAGSMNLTQIVDSDLTSYYPAYTNQGKAVYAWKGSNNINDVGVHTFTAKSGSITNTANLTFDGIKLAISGTTNVGQVLTVKPISLLYTITNNGTIQANNINISYFSLSPLDTNNDGTLDRGDWGSIDSTYNGGCEDGILLSGESCTIKLIINTQQFKDGAFGGKILVSSPDRGLNQTEITISGRSEYPPVLRFEFANNSLGILKAGDNLEKTLTLFNDGPADANLASFSASAPYIIKSTNCNLASIPANTSCNVVVELTSHLVGSYSTTVNIQTEYSSASTFLSGSIIPDKPSIIPIAFDTTSIPSDTISKIQVTVGPIKDSFTNLVNPGTVINFDIDKGKMSLDTTGLNSISALTDSNGYIRFYITSRTTQEVGDFILTAKFLNPDLSVFSSTTKSGSLQGINLDFELSSQNFPDVVIGNVSTANVTIKNKGNVTASNVLFTMSSPIFSVLNPNDCKILLANQSCTLQLSFFSTSANSYSSILRASTASGYGQLEDTITVNARSFLPAKLVLNNPLIEVSLIPGSIYSGSIQLKNDGYETVNNITYSINQNNSSFNIDMSSCSTLSSQQTCTIPFTFTPSSGSGSDFTSIITFNADSPTRSVSVDQTFIGHIASLNISSQYNKLNTDECTSLTIRTVTSSLDPISVTSAMNIQLSSNFSGNFYNTTNCTGSIITSATILANQSSVSSISFKPSNYGAYILSASSTVLSPAIFSLTVNPINVIASLGSNTILQSNNQECEKINIDIKKSDNTLYNVPVNTQINVNSNLSGTWWGDNLCSSVQISAGYFTLNAGNNGTSIYFKPTTAGSYNLNFTSLNKVGSTLSLNVLDYLNFTITGSTNNILCSKGNNSYTCPNTILYSSNTVYPQNLEKTITSNINSGSNQISLNNTTSLNVNDLILIMTKPDNENDWIKLNTYEYFRITQIVNSTTIKVANLIDNGNPTVNQLATNKVRLYVIPEFYNLYLKTNGAMKTITPNLSTGAGGVIGFKVYNKIIGEKSTPVNSINTLNGSVYGDGITIYTDSSNNTTISGGN